MLLNIQQRSFASPYLNILQKILGGIFFNE